MKCKFLFLAALSAVASTAQAQDVYAGVGFPGLVAIGYARPMSANWGLRGEYATGLNLSKDGVENGVNVTGSLKASRTGIFADWFPYQSGFRFVGGLTVNDIKAELNALGTGTSTINGQTVNMAGEVFNVNINYPTVTPYLGIGYGHRESKDKGFGFYADIGVMVGTFNTDVSTSLIGKTFTNGQIITAADIDAQTQSMRDSIGQLSVLPSFSVGMTYRF